MMATRRGRFDKTAILGEIAQDIANGKRTVRSVLERGSPREAAVAAEYYYVLRGIETGSSKLPPLPEIQTEPK
jgi:hypothetical protein